ncbi:MAG TPA: UDP-N-acetylglucosamine--N-acetylmuramyl-(pentapeptide) pyrophosphoryl-undecaprenol N-acetylglucosamine transferase, partial [bacterium]|nr:UDP-N-acetylglucosamine--N-acetylmuramyl-(pentapeptide) pyrophosphoryl-undecaprenol N-acetylglucosamine transferase [bacterium]
GTGGHLYVAVALALHYRRTEPDVEVTISGRGGGGEEKAVAANGLRFASVRTVKLPQKKISLETALFPARLLAAVADGWRLLGELKPSVVAGFGGFGSFPVVTAARLRGIPVYLHEQNALMGLVNKVAARFSEKVFVSYEETEGCPRADMLFVGNPSRFEGVEKTGKTAARAALGLDPEKWTLFSFGGSQGARSINKAMLEWIRINRDKRDMQAIHLAGRGNFEETRREFAEALGEGAALRVEARDYLEEMNLAYEAADLTICRAGATSIAELTSLGVPALLVPYPFATGNHQEKNARRAAEAGAALMALDSELDGNLLHAIVEGLKSDPGKLEEMSRKSRAMYKEGAAAKMAEHISARLKA